MVGLFFLRLFDTDRPFLKKGGGLPHWIEDWPALRRNKLPFLKCPLLEIPVHQVSRKARNQAIIAIYAGRSADLKTTSINELKTGIFAKPLTE